MSDIVERLRAVEHSGGGATSWYRNPDGAEAAAEIERLRSEVDRLRDALAKLAQHTADAAKITGTIAQG